jgi:hypothetical protein
MMSKKIKLLCALSFLFIGPALAQVETEPVQIQSYSPRQVEEFSELKTGKNVRHGAYVRYMPQPYIGMVLFETGNYDHGQKEGEWLLYSEEKPWNIISRGTYHTNEKEGVWTYYHRFVSSPSAARVNNSFTPKPGASKYINDTTAIVQAQGLYVQGRRGGIWTYFDRQKQVVQKIDHFTNQLLYWRPSMGAAASSVAASADHPLLYAGGKAQLQAEIISVLGWRFAFEFDKSRSAEFIYQIDAAGKQLVVIPVDATGLTRYHKLLLQALAKVPPLWVPQVVEGKFTPAQYRVKISVEVEKDGNQTKARTLVEPLGA